MSISDQIKEVEISIEEAKKSIELSKCLEKLKNNREFKKLILQDYFIDEAARAVAGKSNPQLQDEMSQREFDKLIIGIGNLQQYFNKVRFFGEQSQRSLEEHENTLVELNAEAIDA